MFSEKDHKRFGQALLLAAATVAAVILIIVGCLIYSVTKSDAAPVPSAYTAQDDNSTWRHIQPPPCDITPQHRG